MRLLGADDVPIGFLATATVGGVPHLAPVCPIIARDALYLSVPPETPKCRDLRGNGRFVLHAFLGASDEEFSIAGRAVEVTDHEERADVHAAIRFGSFHREHPVFRMEIRSCHWAVWQDAGTPQTRRVVRRWRADRNGMAPSGA